MASEYFSRTILSLMASVADVQPDTSFPKISDTEKIKRIHIVGQFFHDKPWSFFRGNASNMQVGYIVVLLVDGLARWIGELRMQAAIILEQIIRTHPEDAFLESIAPGFLSKSLKLLFMWEKMPNEVTSLLIKSVGKCIQRVWNLIVKEGKIEIILERLMAFAPLVKKDEVIATVFASQILNILSSVLKKKKATENTSESNSKMLIRILAVSCSFHYNCNAENISFLFSELLNDNLRLLHELAQKKAAASSSLLLECLGCLSIISSNLPTETVKSLLDLCKFFQLSQLKGNSLLSQGLPQLNEFAWEGQDGPIFKEIIKRCGNKITSIILSNNEEKSFKDLLILAVSFNGDEVPLIEFVIDFYEDYCGRCWEDQNEEVLFLFSWCSLVNSIVIKADSLNLFTYLLHPLLSVAGSPYLSISNAANQILDIMAERMGYESKFSLIAANSSKLLGLISADLRYPVLYPTAPRGLVLLLHSMIQESSNHNTTAQMIVDVVEEVEEGAAQLQGNPGYIISILEAITECFGVAHKSGHTRRPHEVRKFDKNEVEQGEEEEEERYRHTLEESIASSLVKLSLHFITDDEEIIRVAALNAILKSIKVFKADRDVDIFLPLVHQTWKPLLHRLADHSLTVAKHALLIIEAQASLAGSFMRDRVQKELLPVVGKLLLRESQSVARTTSIKLIVNIIRCTKPSTSARLLIAQLIDCILGLSDERASGEESVKLILALAEVNTDHVWYHLVSIAGPMKFIHPSGQLPMLQSASTTFTPTLPQRNIINSVLSRL